MDIDDIDIKRYVYPNGQPQFEMPYLNGVPYGTHLHWHENGTLSSEHRYKNGLMDGLCIVYRKDGSDWIVFTCSRDLQEGEEIEYGY